MRQAATDRDAGLSSGLAESRYHAVGDWLLDPGSAIRKYKPDIYPAESSISAPRSSHTGQTNSTSTRCANLESGRTHILAPFTKQFGIAWRSARTYAKMMRRMRQYIRLEYASDSSGYRASRSGPG